MHRLILSIAVVLTFTTTAFGASLDVVLAAVEGPFKSGTIADFRGEFFQESRIASLGKIQRAQGEVAVKFAAGGVKFKWDYETPARQQVISDGRMLWVYVPENTQVIETDLMLSRQAGGDNPMAFLTGLGNLSRDFIVVWGTPPQDSESNYRLRLTPRRHSQLIKEIDMVVDYDAVEKGEGFPILATIVTDPGGNRTTIEFSSIETNRGLLDLEFDFIAPAGVDTVYPEDIVPR